jgi:Rrf2 family protein
MSQNYRFAMSIHLMTLLAAEPAQAHTSDEIANSIHCNPVMVRRVLISLHKAGLILSHKGPSGGSRLKKPARQITLADIYHAVEPDALFHLPPKPPDAESAIGHGIQPVLSSVFKRSNAALLEELEGTTLSQVLKKARK